MERPCVAAAAIVVILHRQRMRLLMEVDEIEMEEKQWRRSDAADELKTASMDDAGGQCVIKRSDQSTSRCRSTLGVEIKGSMARAPPLSIQVVRAMVGEKLDGSTMMRST